MVHIFARLVMKPESASAARAILEKLVEETRKEPGSISYELFQQDGAPHIFQTFEVWKSKEDTEAHMKTPHIAAAMKEAGPMFAGKPDIALYIKLK